MVARLVAVRPAVERLSWYMPIAILSQARQEVVDLIVALLPVCENPCDGVGTGGDKDIRVGWGADAQRGESGVGVLLAYRSEPLLCVSTPVRVNVRVR